MQFPYKKALVTGGTGFIGSHLCEALINKGVQVICVDNNIGGKTENIAHLTSRPGFTLALCDVTDFASLKPLFKGVDIVFHNAASKKTICMNDPRKDLDINAKGTFNLLELSRDTGVKKFVHASTGSVYGEATQFPQTEEHPLNPTSYYGVSKLAGEKYVRVFNHLYGLDTTVLRYFHVYGTRQESADEKGGVIAIFSRRLLEGKNPIVSGDGTQQRSFTWVGDVVEANLFVAAHPKTKGEVYNCASGINVTVLEMAKRLVDLLNPKAVIEFGPPTPGDIKRFEIDNSKLTSLGFRFRTSFEEGLRTTIEYYKSK
ncbi:MAG: SDR family NAD(P)-dependent oxidoreductase [Nanoarchaeota archaeon]|nr:SDR family NAD(P)-dependent oxidoreductase [Nanoarchaeota archaeon]